MEADLIEKQTISNTSYYRLTEDGKNTLQYFEKELSTDIRKEVKEYLKTNGYKLHERILLPANYYETNQGTYAVRCQIIEKGASLVDLNIILPNQEAAKSMCRKWPDKCQVIYEKIMEELL